MSHTLKLTDEERDAVERALELYCDISKGRLEAAYDVLAAHKQCLLPDRASAEQELRRVAWILGMTLDSREYRTGNYASDPVADRAQDVLKKLFETK